MKIYISESHNPYINQSIEKLLVADPKEKEDVLFLWLNENAIIIGRNQNIYNEINEEFVKEKDIKISRRLSGGGAVYHDLGNILFSIIRDKGDSHSYEKFLEPIVGFLNELGVQAKFSGRNDVLVDGMKISGNAQFIIKNKMAHHGTLLFNTDLTVLGKSLVTNKHKVVSKGIKSNRQRVTNIKEHMKKEINSQEFLDNLANYFVKNNDAFIKEIPENIILKAKEDSKAISKFEWIYGKSPEAQIHNKYKFDGGNVEVLLNVIKGRISNLQIMGDFLSKLDVNEITNKINGCKFEKEEIRKLLNNTNFSDYFGSIKVNELVNLMLGEVKC